jgi:hypothetical protein
MAVDGANLGDGGKCFIPIFRHYWEDHWPGDKADKSIIMG